MIQAEKCLVPSTPYEELLNPGFEGTKKFGLNFK
jgi:hypothetical protein